MTTFRSREEMEKARQPQYELGKRGGDWHMMGTDGTESHPGNLTTKMTKEGETYIQQILECLLDIRELLQEKPLEKGGANFRYTTTTNVCPPHELIDYVEHQPWSASVPPPNKICVKCLLKILV